MQARSNIWLLPHLNLTLFLEEFGEASANVTSLLRTENLGVGTSSQRRENKPRQEGDPSAYLGFLDVFGDLAWKQNVFHLGVE